VDDDKVVIHVERRSVCHTPIAVDENATMSETLTSEIANTRIFPTAVFHTIRNTMRCEMRDCVGLSQN
jgi:hypothetical protein